MIAKIGDTVKVVYRGIADKRNETVHARDGKPVEFTIGRGEVISGVEEAVVAMREGEEKIVRIPAEKAFGQWSEKNIVVVRRDRLPGNIDLEVGKRLSIRARGGRRAIITVSEVSESTVTLDANHSLSGKDLTLRIRLLEVIEGSDRFPRYRQRHAQANSDLFSHKR